MKKVSLLALALSTTITSGASAQTAVAQVVNPAAPCAVPCPCPKAFQGFAFGGNLGYGIGASQLKNSTSLKSVATPAAVSTVNDTFNSAYQGVDGGLLVGYTHRFNNFAVGLDFYANWTSAKGQGSENIVNTAATSTGATNTTDTFGLKLQNTLDLRATFGYVINNLVLPKFMLGWENASYQVTASQALNVPGAANQSNTSRLNGFLWGFGVDFLVAKNIVCGLEYTGVALAKKTLNYTYTNGTTNYASATSIQPAAYNKFAVTAKFVY